jgi:signal transduction histidine kinase
LLVFALVLAALSAGAYWFMAIQYRTMLGPALGDPIAEAGYRAAMLKVTLTILSFDVPLLLIVGAASYWLASASIRPLIEARERERAFAADAAHELRSPLATIASVAQASAAQANERDAAAFSTIAQAALDASSLVADLLTLARAANGTLLACEPVDVGAIAASVSKEFTPVAETKHLRLETQTESAIVNGDERRLRELVRNLLENALRHARSSVRVSTMRNGRRVELLVSNDGEPVEPQLRLRIFERFFKGSDSEAGSGLGLAIVSWIARAHGGEAFVRDGTVPGAEFVVQLPLFSE